ncbi:MAG: PhoH family protein [Endomicrobiia bacterium]|nr:PhoH family protein [Endomicrobiia bacterium]
MKTFVLDTNVLIHDPDAFLFFKNSEIIIPITVIEELDGLKRATDERGRAARAISRNLNALRNGGRLSDGVKLKNGSVLKIVLGAQSEKHLPFAASLADNRILSIVLDVQSQKKDEKVVFITKDINLRIKAEVLGIDAQDYEKEKVSVEDLYNGWREMEVADSDVDAFYAGKKMTAPSDFLANECVVLKGKNSGSSAIAKYNFREKSLRPLFHQNASPWGLKPLNVHQKFAFELLLCNDINLVTLIGVPGAGKTLISLACGMQKVLEEKSYAKLFIARPVVPMGRDIGYLPGTKEEKLTSWMGAIYDNFEFLLEKKSPGADISSKVSYLFDTGALEIEALTYIRGRSLPNQYIIIDDAQNLTPHEVKTIISRAGSGTKIILTGDPHQIDNPYLDASSNGLTNLVERFKGQEMYGHITFNKTERSALAALASELL